MSVRSKMVRSDLFGSIGIGSHSFANGTLNQGQMQICPESPMPTVFDLGDTIEQVLGMPFVDGTLWNTLNPYNSAGMSYAQIHDDTYQAQIDAITQENAIMLWGNIKDGGVGIVMWNDYAYLFVSYGLCYNETSDKYMYVAYTIQNMWGINGKPAIEFNTCFFAFPYDFVPATVVNPKFSWNPTIDPDRGQAFELVWPWDLWQYCTYKQSPITSVNPTYEVDTGYNFQWFSVAFSHTILGYTWDWDGEAYFHTSPVFERTYSGAGMSQGTSYIWEYPPAGWEEIEGSSVWGGETIPDTPDNDGGGNGDDGGGGQYDDDGSDGRTPYPNFEVDVLDTGFVNLYLPTKQQLRDLATFLFTGITESASIVLKRLVANPLDYIIGLNLCHLNLSGEYSEYVKFGGINTNVSMTKASSQFLVLNGGTCQIDEQKQTMSYLDYSPFTRCKIWIPYCGEHELPIDLVMGGTLKLTYIVDILTGAMTANVEITRDRNTYISNKHLENGVTNEIVATYTGNCFEPLPVASTDYRNVVNGVLGLAGGMATSIATGNPLPLISSGANAVMNSKPIVNSTGSTGACYGYMNQQTAFLTLSRAIPNFDWTYSEYEGYPCNQYGKVKDFTGYLEVEKGTFWVGDNKHNFSSITDSEMDEIQQYMEGGVWV